MSLNKFVNTQTGKDLKLQIGADEIKCNTLTATTLNFTDETVENLIVTDSLTVKNTLYPTKVPLGNAISMMSGNFSSLNYAVSPYVFLNTIPQSYNLTADPQVVAGATTLTSGLSNAYITIADNSLYYFEFIFNYSDFIGTLYTSLVLNNYTVLTIPQSIPDSVNNYFKVSGKVQCVDGWGTNAAGIIVVLQCDYMNTYETLKETLFTTVKTGLNTVPYLNTLPIPLQIKMSSTSTGSFNRIMGNISCVYNDFSQNA
jgi:hypothetical protein